MILKEMRSSLEESRLSAQREFESDKQEAERLVASYDKKLKQLSEVVLPGLLEDIERKEGTPLLAARPRRVRDQKRPAAVGAGQLRPGQRERGQDQGRV